jgi:hypothetical protein
MRKQLLISLATATLLTSSLNAQSMYERFIMMEIEMKEMQEQIKLLKSDNPQNNVQQVQSTPSTTIIQKADTRELEQRLETLSMQLKTLQENAVTSNNNIEEVEEDDYEEESSDETEEDLEESVDDEAEEENEEGDDDEEEEETPQSELEERLASIEEELNEVNSNTSGNHLKLNVDFRTTLDNINYKMADGSEQGNDAFLTNRLWINMAWAPTENILFRGQLAYNKTYGARSGASNPQSNSNENFDWITSENPYDGVLRVRSAYFYYLNDTFMGTDIPWTFSIGRRPSTNGHLINFRDDDGAASPLAHSINVEFDGLSSKFSFEKLFDISGMYVKLCAGRGLTNASPRFTPAPYATSSNDVENIDLFGVIFVPYDNGQYQLATQFYYANNLIDAINPNDQTQGYQSVGNLSSFTTSFTIDGIGDEWSDYLDESILFASFATSVTHPDEGQLMLGDSQSQMGYSMWMGAQMPSLFSDEGRFGLEYNYGSRYWRAITYGEDTMVGSKVAARGSAYEMYFTEPLIDDVFSLQVRYTFIDYDYTGSNGFFGGTTGTPLSMDEAIAGGAGALAVDTAQDIRVYLRYKY